MEKYREQTQDHRRIIERFIHIQTGKQLSVQPSRRGPGKLSPLKSSLNWNKRQKNLKKIDAENIQILDRLANPKPSINLEEFNRFSRQQRNLGERLHKSKRSDFLRASEWRKEYLRKTLSKDLQLRMSTELEPTDRISPELP